MASTTTARTRTRQATATRSAASRATKPTSAPPKFAPIHIPANDDVPDERVPIFFIGDTEYTVPTLIPPGVGLEYLRVAGERGQDMAAAVILTRVLGDEAYAALEQARGLTPEQLQQIVQLVVDQAMGAMESKEEAEEGKAG